MSKRHDNDISAILTAMSAMPSPVDDSRRTRLPLEEIIDLLPVQARPVKVRQLPCDLRVRERLELLTELHKGELVLQGRSHLPQKATVQERTRYYHEKAFRSGCAPNFSGGCTLVSPEGQSHGLGVIKHSA